MVQRPAGQPIDVETARFRLRTLKSADASARWQGWGKDPEIMGPLNAPVRDMPLDYLANYATSFDNEHRHLIGIFEKASSTHIGFFIIEIDRAHRCATFNVVIGDKAWWGKGVVNEHAPRCSITSLSGAASRKRWDRRSHAIFRRCSITRRKAGGMKARCAAIACPSPTARGSTSISSNCCARTGASSARCPHERARRRAAIAGGCRAG